LSFALRGDARNLHSCPTRRSSDLEWRARTGRNKGCELRPREDGVPMAASPVQPGQVRARKPDWLKKRIPDPQAMREMRALLDELKLNTICEEAGCPNIGECWAQRTATFLILGDICTRACGFCDVKTGRPEPVNVAEPYHVARAVKRLGLSHVVITSPDRDDLPDKGSEQFAATIRAVHRLCPGTTVE